MREEPMTPDEDSKPIKKSKFEDMKPEDREQLLTKQLKTIALRVLNRMAFIPIPNDVNAVDTVEILSILDDNKVRITNAISSGKISCNYRSIIRVENSDKMYTSDYSLMKEAKEETIRDILHHISKGGPSPSVYEGLSLYGDCIKENTLDKCVIKMGKYTATIRKIPL
jgi:hypothetical protein